MFSDRTHAGKQLATSLRERELEADIVLGIPRGGLPVAKPVAETLGVPLDVVVASKIGAPSNPELAIGAVASDGSLWRNDELISRLGVSEAYIETERKAEIEYARKKAERYRGDGHLPDLAGKRVIVVDDGLATGATAIACLRLIREAGAAHLTLAVPVGSPRSVADLQEEADSVIALETPTNFGAVGQFYQRFGQVSDEEAMALLANATDQSSTHD